MEHRLSARERLSIPIMLYRQGLPVLTGISDDIGLGGLFVRTRSALWHINECYEVELSCAGVRTLRLRAVVVHWREDGVGLMFDEMTDSQRADLLHLLDITRRICADSATCGAAA